MTLSGRVAIVTGGGRGIGKAIALSFAQEGACVVVIGPEETELVMTQQEMIRLGSRAVAVVADVSDEKKVNDVVNAMVSKFGRIDVLVNNAAIVGPTKLVVDVSRKEWDEVLAVNLTGAFLCSKAVLGPMINKRKGKIINISSVAGKMAYPLRSAYSVSKWGLIGLTQTLAKEVGEYNIQVNAVCPGPVAGARMDEVIRGRAERLGLSFEEVEKTYVESTALKRMVQSRDIARLVLFLASDAADNITGQAIDVDAGYRM